MSGSRFKACAVVSHANPFISAASKCQNKVQTPFNCLLKCVCTSTLIVEIENLESESGHEFKALRSNPLPIRVRINDQNLLNQQLECVCVLKM